MTPPSPSLGKLLLGLAHFVAGYTVGYVVGRFQKLTDPHPRNVFREQAERRQGSYHGEES